MFAFELVVQSVSFKYSNLPLGVLFHLYNQKTLFAINLKSIPSFRNSGNMNKFAVK
jgi:hypothetical protein